MTSQFADMTSLSIFFDVAVFFSSSLVTGPSLMSMSLMVLELWQFSLLRDWPEIQKLDIPPPKLLNAAKCQGYNFYWFLVIKGKPTGDEG